LTVSVSIPGRINILGNPTDGLEGDFYTISCAITLRTYGVFEESEAFLVDVRTQEGAGSYQTVLRNEYKYNGKYDIVKAAIRRLQKESPEFSERFKFRLTTWTDIPDRSGLGGSSAVINMILVGCRALRSRY
jgi:galactokinase